MLICLPIGSRTASTVDETDGAKAHGASEWTEIELLVFLTRYSLSGRVAK